MEGAVLGGGGGAYIPRYGGAVSRYWRGCFEIWELLKSVLGGGYLKYVGMAAYWLASEPVDCLARVRVSVYAVFLDLQNVRES